MSSGKLLFERLAATLPAGVNAVMTTRRGGVSAEVYSSFNLAIMLVMTYKALKRIVLS